MAKVKCEYCDNYINDTLENCDVCGAVNPNYQRMSNNTPKTIEELKAWYVARSLPPEETTRFFIGKNIKEPKAFGIYQEGRNFVVYKNKANGERAVRYKGTDEAYAVNELYLRLKEEILNQKRLNLKNQKTSLNEQCAQDEGAEYYRTGKRCKKERRARFFIMFSFFGLPLLMFIYIIIIFTCALVSDFSIKQKVKETGYYYYDQQFYYYLYDIHGSYGTDNTGWYIYEDNNWKYYCSEENSMLGYELENSKEDYKIGRNFSDLSRNQDSFSYKWYPNDFSTTQWYSSYERNNDRYEEHMEEVRSNSSSSDSDYDWSSSDSWDSGSTDWDSDW